jgi:hypothetical protein
MAFDKSISERIESIIRQLFELFGQGLGHLASKIEFIETLFLALLKGFQTTLTADRLIQLTAKFTH